VGFGIAKLPDGIDFTEAAALGLAGTAAVDAFDASGVTANQTVLVVGATGGVGQQALQLAVRTGATVMGTAHSREESELVTKLGAAHTVDYR
jgi:NADPH:quinone reductase